MSAIKAEQANKGRYMANKNGEDAVLTVTELARYLRMKPITIYKHVAGGKLPGFKVGSHWRFKKATIDSWIENQESSNLRVRKVSTN